MIKKVFLVSVIFMLVCVVFLPAGEVVINEVYYDAPGTDNGVFTELYGTPGLDLSGYKLVGVNGFNGNEYAEIVLSGTIPSDGFFVVAADSSVVNFDIVDSNVDWQNGKKAGGDAVKLVYNDEIIDAVAYGGHSEYGEGDYAPDVSSGHSLGRVPDGHDTNDNSADFVDMDTPTPGESNGSTPPVYVIHTIYEIQCTDVPEGNSPFLDSLVIVKGLVVAKFSTYYFIQDGNGVWNGIEIYDPNYSVELGDSVVVHGKVVEYQGMTEIGNVTNTEILSSGNDLPEPTIILCDQVGSEQFEGVFVKILDVNVTDVTDWEEDGVWQITDSSEEEANVDHAGTYNYVPQVGDHINFIVGIIKQNEVGYVISPRNDADLDVELMAADVLINEIYYDAPGSDAGVFTELYGPPGTNLTGYTLVGYNGSDSTGTPYRTVVLYGQIPEDSLFVIAKDSTIENFDIVIPDIDWQNGPDAVNLLFNGEVIDAVAYGTDGYATQFGEGDPTVDVIGGHSIGRYPDGVDTDDNSVDFKDMEVPTPGEKNVYVGINGNINLAHVKLSNYPNPFNPNTTISFELPKNAFVSLKMYNIHGELVEILVPSQKMNAGKYSFIWNAKKLSSGIYFYKLKINDDVKVNKCLLLK